MNQNENTKENSTFTRPAPKNARRKGNTSVSMVEVSAICIVVVVATLFIAERVYREEMYLGSAAIEELERFRSYGPSRSSRYFEEWIIRDHFQDRRNGVFLDVGANHYKDESNTYFLETSLGWSGLAIEPIEEFAADYKSHRPKTRFVGMFASDVPDSKVQFFVPENSLLASSDADFAKRYGAAGKAREVPTTTLNAVLDQARIGLVDFVSMDIELAEPKALAGFDIERFRPSLVCIEAHPEVRQQILDYFQKHQYVAVGKYLRADPQNLYFRPISQ